MNYFGILSGIIKGYAIFGRIFSGYGNIRR